MLLTLAATGCSGNQPPAPVHTVSITLSGLRPHQVTCSLRCAALDDAPRVLMNDLVTGRDMRVSSDQQTLCVPGAVHFRCLSGRFSAELSTLLSSEQLTFSLDGQPLASSSYNLQPQRGLLELVDLARPRSEFARGPRIDFHVPP